MHEDLQVVQADGIGHLRWDGGRVGIRREGMDAIGFGHV